MIKPVMIALVCWGLAGCVPWGDGTDLEKAEKIQQIVSTSCNITPRVGDLLAVVAHPAFGGVRPTAEFICSQFLGDPQAVLGLMSKADEKCIAIVNDVCIGAEENDTDEGE